MFGQIYYHGTIRKYVVYFGTIFNDIYLTRTDSTGLGNQEQTMKVPLGYGPKDKFLARLQGNPELDRPIAIQLPHMAFEIVNFQYDSDRKRTTTGKVSNISSLDSNKKNFQYNPVPYNFIFKLYIMVKNADDGTRIIEQILPSFTPEFVSTLNLNPDLSQQFDVPLILNAIEQEDTYEGNFETRRALIWTLTFTMKGYLFGPTRSSGVIKQTEIHIEIPNGNVADATELTPSSGLHITIKPGLTIGGLPTSNAILSIDKSLIKSTDNYGFIMDFQDNG